MTDPRRTSAAAFRNRDPILAVLRRLLPEAGLVLEIAAGSGLHVVHFASHLPHLTWQPSDPDPDARASIGAYRGDAGLANLRPPVELDVRRFPWPVAEAQAILSINMIHIAPWDACKALMTGAGRLLDAGAPLILYGPFRREGRHTAPSNEAFDQGLRAQDPEWGVRDLEAVNAQAAVHGLVYEEIVEMPANNLTVVYRKQGGIVLTRV